MERMKASDFPQELLDVFHLYVHGDIDRRAFLDRAGKFAVGGLTAAAILDMLKPNYAWAQQVPKEDARIRAEYVTVQSPQGNGTIKGYFVRPAKAAGKLPTILVVHENRGLNPYVEDVARRLGTANFIALAPDGLTSVGGYPGDDEKGGALFGKVDRAKMTEDFVAAANWLKAHAEGNGRVGVVGFCFGGGIANTLAVRMPDLAAAVPFYGGAPAEADVAKIKAAVLVHHGQADTRLAEGWPAQEAALKANKIRYEGYVYPNAQHGFHNDTTPRYDEAAAKLAWQRTIDWFNKYTRTT
ncbi:MAG TPA: dienelactone hydrolase family protein [Vicinamibacterales bacterium]|nr:dienelactone hydrolase family protein [Vicinamibacterales bacterium]